MKGLYVWVGLWVTTLMMAEEVEIKGMKFSYEVVSNEVIFTLEAPTKGWIAIGWGATSKMKDADYLIGYVTNGNVGVLEDHFGVSVIGHRRDRELGGTDDFRLIDAREKDGVTRMVFARLMSVKDSFDVPIVLDKPLDIILAYGNFDNTTSKHVVVSRVKITIKRK